MLTVKVDWVQLFALSHGLFHVVWVLLWIGWLYLEDESYCRIEEDLALRVGGL